MNTSRVLVVDDEAFNLDILQEHLSQAGYDVLTAPSGAAALKALTEYGDIDLVVLDRMMPQPNGMDVLHTMKAHAPWREIPVVMQTAAGTQEQIAEGMRAGAYHYLVKPYEEQLLLAMVKSAISDTRQRRVIRDELRKFRRGLSLVQQMTFRFRTMAEARELGEFVAQCFPEVPSLQLGLTELAVNAVEHGNLGISYREKSELLLRDRWEAEVARREALPENANKYAELTLAIKSGMVAFHLRDQGDGFDWQQYQDFAIERATDPHGRGIAMARTFAFSSIEYLGNGNELRCSIELDAPATPSQAPRSSRQPKS
ncbi:MAG: response regulator [Polyangiaceae bacterium]